MKSYRRQSESISEELKANNEWENSIKPILYRASCPPAQDLGEFQLGMLDSTETAQIELHLQYCPHCVQELAQLDAFLAATKPTIHLQEVEQSKIQVLIAKFVDQAADALAPAMALRGNVQRGDSPDTPQVYSYEVDDIEINFEVLRNPATLNQWTIEGEIDTGNDEDVQWQVAVWRTDLPEPECTQRTSVDPIEMLIEGLKAGKYALLFSDGVTREVHIPHLQIGFNENKKLE